MGSGTSSGRNQTTSAATPTPTAQSTASPTYGNDVTAIRTAIPGLLRDSNFEMLTISNPSATYHVTKDDSGGFRVQGQEQTDRDDGFQGYQINQISRTFSDRPSAVRYIRSRIGADSIVRNGRNQRETLFRGANVGRRVSQNEMKAVGTTPRDLRYVRTRQT